MANTRRMGRTIGALMLAHLALGLIGPYVVLVPMTAPPGGFLENAAGMAGAIRASVLALIVGASLPLIMVALAWPCWRGASPALGLSLLGLAASNLALQMLENSMWLSMLTVSEAHQSAGVDGAGQFSGIAVAFRALFRWSHYSHILVLVTWLLLLFVTLWRRTLVPRWLAALGVLASVLHLTTIPLPEFVGLRLASAAYWGMPLAGVYLGTALLLVVRGFPPKVARGGEATYP